MAIENEVMELIWDWGDHQMTLYQANEMKNFLIRLFRAK